jgi:hypothetical protein
MADQEQQDDGVQRDKLDYRAGYIEGLRAAMQAIKVNGIRAKRSEVAGLDAALTICRNLRAAMIQKMKGGGD